MLTLTPQQIYKLAPTTKLTAIFDGKRFYDGGYEYPVSYHEFTIGGSIVRTGGGPEFYFNNKELPFGIRAVVRSEDSPCAVKLRGYEDMEIYEMQVYKCLPKEVSDRLRGDGFSYWFDGRGVRGKIHKQPVPNPEKQPEGFESEFWVSRKAILARSENHPDDLIEVPLAFPLVWERYWDYKLGKSDLAMYLPTDRQYQEKCQLLGV